MPGGRPYDPRVDRLALDAVHHILATRGIDAVTASAICEHANIGRAAIYRRWPSMPAVITAAVREMGVRPQDVLEQPIVGGASIRADIIAVVTAATIGPRADAERAILSALPHDADLRIAYRAGPGIRLEDALDAVMNRAVNRGDAAGWPGNAAILGAIATLHMSALVDRVDHRRPEAVLRQIGAIR